MCGVFGLVNIKGQLSPESMREFTQRATDSLFHRGPDGSGVWLSPDGRIGLGHRRLAIIDLSDQAAQPMVSSTGHSTLVFNGEIYNHMKLRESLSQPWRSHSDSETLLAWLEEFGTAKLGELDGMFAVGVFNSKLRSLNLAVDRVGKKPLYTYWDGRLFAFSSELKAFAQAGCFDLTPANDWEKSYSQFGYVPSPETCYRYVRKLPAGHWQNVSIDAGPTAPQEYWDLPLGKRRSRLKLADVEADLRELIRLSVKKRLLSDVPVGCLLSGGLDSSIIATEMARLHDGPFSTFNAAFAHRPEGKEFDESFYAEQVAQKLKATHHSFSVTLSESEARKINQHLDEPFADSSALACAPLFQQTAQRVKVVLSGDGGDELFGGYRRMRAALWSEGLGKTLRLFPLLPAGSARGPVGYYNRFVRGSKLPLWSRLVAWHDFEFPDSDDLPVPVRRLRERCGDLEAREQILYFNFKSYLFDDLLVKVDRISMAYGLEVRCPFLDRDLIEFVWTLPVKMQLGLFGSKNLLKNIYRAELGREIVDRPKQGFGVPLRQLFPHTPAADLSRAYLQWTMQLWKQRNGNGTLTTLTQSENRSAQPRSSMVDGTLG